jgi:uncharacterized protein YdeI (BOF family)
VIPIAAILAGIETAALVARQAEGLVQKLKGDAVTAAPQGQTAKTAEDVEAAVKRGQDRADALITLEDSILARLAREGK